MSATALRGRIGRFQLFALGFGSIIGSAWAVILNQWLEKAGPGGAVLGFIAGGLVIICIGACYAELTARVPRAGGDFAFALEAYGRNTAFFVGWFVALGWISITVFEGLAIARILTLLFPHLPDVALYRLFDTPVTRNELLTGLIGATLVIGTNLRGGTAAARLQGALTSAFLVFAILLLLAMVALGKASNLTPLFSSTTSIPWWQGTIGIFASCAFLLNGFQTICQAVEERSDTISLATVARVMLVSIAVAAGFYCLAITAGSMILPWHRLAHSDLAMMEATRALPYGALLGQCLLVILLASLLKTWNGVFLAATRILLGLAREGLLPTWFAKVDARYGAPQRIVLLAGFLNIAGLLLGHGAISSLVDTSAASIVLCFVLSCIAVPVLRRRQPGIADFSVPGGHWIIVAAIAGSIVMAGAAVVTPLFGARSLPVEYLILGGWALLGALILFGRRRGQAEA